MQLDVMGRELPWVSRSRPRWVIVSEEVEQSPREKVLKAGRVVKRAEYRDRSRYTGETLRGIRRDHGVGRPPWWRASVKDYWDGDKKEFTKWLGN